MRSSVTRAVRGIFCVMLYAEIANTSANATPFGADPWGIEIGELCSLPDGAPIGDKCYGFIAGVVESLVGKEVARRPQDPRRLCGLPRDIRAIVTKIRPELRTSKFQICAGYCTTESYVASAIYDAYPCQKAIH